MSDWLWIKNVNKNAQESCWKCSPLGWATGDGRGWGLYVKHEGEVGCRLDVQNVSRNAELAGEVLRPSDKHVRDDAAGGWDVGSGARRRHHGGQGGCKGGDEVRIRGCLHTCNSLLPGANKLCAGHRHEVESFSVGLQRSQTRRDPPVRGIVPNLLHIRRDCEHRDFDAARGEASCQAKEGHCVGEEWGHHQHHVMSPPWRHLLSTHFLLLPPKISQPASDFLYLLLIQHEHFATRGIYLGLWATLNPTSSQRGTDSEERQRLHKRGIIVTLQVCWIGRKKGKIESASQLTEFQPLMPDMHLCEGQYDLPKRLA